MAKQRPPNLRTRGRPIRLLCIETEWEKGDEQRRQSVARLLEILGAEGDVRFEYLTASTRGELDFHLARWWDGRREFGSLELLYLAFHGLPGALQLADGTEVSLKQLENRLKARCQGRAIHFASCSVMDVPEAKLGTFVKATGLEFVSGYTTSVDWVESAANDLLLLSYLKRFNGRLDSVYGELQAGSENLLDVLGFRTWPDVRIAT